MGINNERLSELSIRIMDIIFAIFGLVIFSPLSVVVAGIVWQEHNTSLFKQNRVGRHGESFMLYKFQTFPTGLESLPTHLADQSVLSSSAKFLRKYKLDELPQLWNVLIGDMSFVGPRPCLLNQYEVIEERSSLGVFNFKPGITGLSQVRGIEMSTPRKLAESDSEMLERITPLIYLKIIGVTVISLILGSKNSYIEI